MEWKEIWEIILWFLTASGATSFVLRFLPVVHKEHWAVPILRFLGKVIAMNRTIERPEPPKKDEEK